MKSKVIFILCLLLVVLSMSSVNASDIDDIAMQTADDASDGVVSSDNVISPDSSEDNLAASSDDENILSTSFSELQSLINNATEGSQINLTKDYSLADGGNTILISKNITIDGGNHVLDANGITSIFKIQTDGKPVVLKNIKFQNGYAANGGAIWNGQAQTSITVINCEFTKCKVNFFGGAIFSAGYLEIINSKFDSNEAYRSAGAIYAKGDLTVTSSQFNGNAAKGSSLSKNYAGAIWSIGKCQINSSSFTNNFADNYGGAIYANDTLTLIGQNSFTSNRATNYGGAVYASKNLYVNWNNHAESARCEMKSNSATGDDGGAIYCEGSIYGKYLIMENNKAKVDGGAIYCKGKTHINSSEFTHNVADGALSSRCFGGAIRSVGDCVIDSSSFENNYAENYGGAIYTDGTLTITGQNTYRFTSNSAKSYGGAIYALKNVYINWNNPAESVKCEMKSNSANGDDGGAIYCEGNVYGKYLIMEGNKAHVDGGAIYCKGETHINSSSFTNNVANGAVSKCFGGAIRSIGKCYLDSDIFMKNFAENYGGAVYADDDIIITRYDDYRLSETSFESNEAKYGGAIYACKNVYIDWAKGSHTTDFYTNRANDEDGGAIYCKGNVFIHKAEFDSNKALVDGGAVYCKGESHYEFSTFKHNVAKSNQQLLSPKNYGGAVYGAEMIYIDSCTFDDNNAYNLGGAVYADKDVSIKNSEFTSNNAMEGGAVYTSVMTKPLTGSTFDHNRASSGHGGAIYINNKCNAEFISSMFVDNTADGKGGAVYLDSSNAHLKVSYCTFIANKAGGTGKTIYNCGDYDLLDMCWFGTNNPNFDDQFKIFHMFKSDEDCIPNNYLKIKMEFNDTEFYKGNIYKEAVRFYAVNGKNVSKDVPHYPGWFSGDAEYFNSKTTIDDMTTDVVFSSSNPKVTAKIDNQYLEMTLNVKDKATSAVSLSCEDVTFPKPLIAVYSITNMTSPSYAVKDRFGKTVKEGNLTNASGTITVEDLETGKYTITLTNPDSWTVTSASKTVSFEVMKMVSVNITADNVVYGNPTTITLKTDYDGLYFISLKGVTYEMIAVNGSCVRSIVLDAGDYQTSTTSKEYAKINCSEAKFTVKKADVELDLNVEKKYVYPESITGTVTASVPGEYAIRINNYIEKINIVNGTYNFSIGGFDAGQYQIAVGTSLGDNYNPKAVVRDFEIAKGDVAMALYIPDALPSQEVTATAFSTVDGNYSIVIGDNKHTMIIENNLGSLNLGKLSPGKYTARIVFYGNNNYNAAVNSTKFTVSKNDFSFNITANKDKYTYGENVSITPKLPLDATGTIEYSINGKSYGKLAVNETLELKMLDAGSYLVKGLYSGNSKYYSQDAGVTFMVDRAVNNVCVDAFNSEYGKPVTIEIEAKADGTYTVNVGDKKLTVTVKNGKGSATLGLNAGEYTTKTTFTDKNYDTKISEDSFIVYKAINNVTVTVEDVSYGTPSQINIVADVGGHYTVDINGTQLEIGVRDGEGIGFAMLDVGEYTTKTTFVSDNYDSKIDESTFTVTNATNRVKVTAKDVTYGNETVINIIAELDGDYTVDINGTRIIVPVRDGEGKASVKLNAGRYNTTTSFEYPDYVNNITEAYFNVFMENMTLNIVVFDCTYPDEVKGNIFGEVDGAYGVTIAGHTQTVMVEKGVGKFAAGVHDPGKYNATVIYVGDDNYRKSEKTITFEIKKGQVQFSINTNSTDIVYGDHVKVTPAFNKNVEGSISYSLSNGRDLGVHSVNESIILPELDVGSYVIIANYSGDKLYESAIDKLPIVVKKAKNHVYVTVADEVYPTPCNVNIKADISGEYKVNINGTQITVNVIGGIGNQSVLMDTGSYATITKFDNKNYDTIIEEAKFNVKKNSISASIEVSDCTYKEEVIGTIHANVTGEYIVTIGDYKRPIMVRNGIGQFDAGIMDAGSYVAEVSFAGNNNYNPVYNKTSFTVKKANAELYAFASDTTHSNNAMALLLGNFDGNVTVSVEGYFNESVAVNDGFAVVDMGKLPAGNYTLNAVFNGNNNFNSASYNSTFQVYEGDLKFEITTGADSYVYGDTIIVSHTINGDATGTIAYYINDDTFLGEADVSKNFTLPKLDVGNYAVIGKYSGDNNYFPAMSVTSLTITDLINNVAVSVENVTYGSPSVINVKADVDGEYTVVINGNPVNVNVKDGRGQNSISLDAGSYSTVTKFKLDNYVSKVTEASFEVRKAETSLNIIVADVTYSEDVEGVVHASVDGKYEVTVGNNSITVTVNDGIGSFDLGEMDAGDYNATVSFSGNKNYNGNENSTSFTVDKAEVGLIIYIEDCTYPEEVVVEVYASVDGEYIIWVGEFEETVNVVNFEATKVLPPMHAGEYDAYVVFEGNDNFNANFNSTIFTIEKADSELSISTDKVFVYGEYITVNHVLTPGATGTISYCLSDGTDLGEVAVDVNYTLPKLFDVGNYTIFAIYNGDLNYYAAIDIAEFEVIKTENNAEVKVEDVTYGENSVIEVTADIDGDYKVDINGTVYDVAVKNGYGSRSVALDAGKYYANVTFSDEKYDTKSKNTKFEVKKAMNNVLVFGTSVVYGENAIILVAADIDGNYTVEVAGQTYDVEVDYGLGFVTLMLDAGNYSTKTAFENSNYESFIIEDTFEVAKADNNVTVFAFDTTYVNQYPIVIAGDIDGMYDATVNGIAYKVNVTEGIGIIDAGMLDAGQYNVSVTYPGDKNFNPSDASESFTIYKEDNEVEIDVIDVVYGEYSTVIIVADFDGEYEVTINGIPFYATVEDGIGYIDAGMLDAGQYNVSATYPGTKNINPAKASATFTVFKEDIELIIVAFDVVYPEEVEGMVYASVDGEYNVTIGNYSTVVTVEDNLGYFNAGKMDVGTYEAVVTFKGNDNYNSARNTTTFNVTAEGTEFEIDISATEFDYGETAVVTHTLPENATGTIRYYLNDGTELGELPVGENLTLPVLDAGSYAVIAEYSGDANHDSAWDLVAFTVNKASSDISVDVSVNGSSAEITVDVAPDATGNVTITVNDNITQTLPLKDGKVTFTLDNLSDGVYYADISYSGDDNHEAESASTSFVIGGEVLDTKLITPSRVIYVSDAVAGYVYQIILKDENGKAVAGREVIFEFNNRNYTAVTGDDGWANVTVYANEEGSYDIKVTFKGDSMYNAVTQTGSIKLVKESVIFITPDRAVYYSDIANGYVYQAILKTKDGKALANKKVLVTFNGKKQVVYTDEKGYITVKLSVSDTGSYAVELKFAGDRYCNQMSDIGIINVVADQTKFIAPNRAVYQSDMAKGYTYQAILKTKDGKPIAGKEVSITFNGKKVVKVTDSKGYVTLQLSVNSIGSYRVDLQFTGDSCYRPVKDYRTIRVVKDK